MNVQKKYVYENQRIIANEQMKTVEKMIKSQIPQVDITEVGFGTGTHKVILEENPDGGMPDLLVSQGGREICYIETQATRGVIFFKDDIWVRPDKIAHCRKFLQQGKKTFIWHIAKNCNWILEDKDILDRQNFVIHPFVYGIIETTCTVPASRGKDLYYLYTFIRKNLR